jgi:glycosyltransferase involved in cell wall biosynthesis
VTLSTRVSAVVVNFNAGPDLIECLQSLQRQTQLLHEVIVVDNASTDLSLMEASTRFPNVIAIANSTNIGFAAGANQGAGVATGDAILFLNPDVSLSPTCVEEVSKQLEKWPGVVGVALSLGADTHELYGCTVDRLGYPMSLQSPGLPLYVAGAVLATSRALFQKLEGFDERYFMFVEDVDYCWKALIAGFEVSVCPEAHAAHRGGGAARGGYVRSGKIETTAFRFALRERNTLATLLKCAPLWWSVWVVPAYVAKTAILVIGSLVYRRPDLARSLLAGLSWNFLQASQTYRLRRRLNFSKEGQQAALRRIYRGWLAIERLRAYGLPQFVDQPGQTTVQAQGAAHDRLGE